FNVVRCPNLTAFFVSLMSLKLSGWTNVKSQIQYISTLRDLTIENFNGLETLPEWLGNIPCLQRLELLDCSNLKQLPSAEAMRCITNIQQLRIRQCPLLVQRRTKDSDAE
ncbi:hypothetical protein ACH5RR_040320, partial [Cinchona calisaya]